MQGQAPTKRLSYPNVDPCSSQLGGLASPTKDPTPTEDNTPITASDMYQGSKETEKLSHDASSFKLYRPYENLIEKPHISAFKPVLTASCQPSMGPIDFSMNKEDKCENLQKEQQKFINSLDNSKRTCKDEALGSRPSSISSSLNDGNTSNIDEEVLDVDTVEGQQVDITDDTQESGETDINSQSNQNPQTSFVKFHPDESQHQSLLESEENTTANLDERINKLLDEMKRDIRRKYLLMDNNNGSSCSKSASLDNNSDILMTQVHRKAGEEDSCNTDIKHTTLEIPTKFTKNKGK